MRKPRMVVGVEGQESSGKTHFALTAPGPITYLNLDNGLEGVLDNALFAEKHVEVKNYPTNLPEGMAIEGQAARAWYKNIVSTLFADYRAAIRDGARTVVLDTGTELLNFIKLSSAEDKKWVEWTEEYRQIFKLSYESEQTSVIVLHRVKPVWGKQDGKSYKKAGEWEPDFYEGTPHDLQLRIRTRFQPPIVEGGQIIRASAFWQDILKSRDNVSLTGLTMPAMDFASVCGLACPSVDWSK